MERSDPMGPGWRTPGIATATLLFILSLISATALGVRAGEPQGETQSPGRPTAAAADEEDRLTITADRLDVDSDIRTATFGGNVRAVQGDMVISADRLKVFFNGDVTGDKERTADEASIKKIIASSSVTIALGDRIAEAGQAEYRADEKVLVLSGGHPRVMMGDNSITGTTITYHRTDGHISVEGDGNRRVNAVFAAPTKGQE